MAQRSYGSIAGDAAALAPRAGTSRSMVSTLAAGGAIAAALGLVAVAMLGGAERSTELVGTWTKPTGIGIDQVPPAQDTDFCRWLPWRPLTAAAHRSGLAICAGRARLVVRRPSTGSAPRV